MNVVIVCTSMSRKGGGVSEAVRLHALSLLGRVDLKVYCVESISDADDLTLWDGISVYRFKRNRVFGKLAVSWGMLFALLRSEADIVHLHGLWQFPAFAVYLWSKLTGRPYVVSPHGMLEPWILKRSAWIKRVWSVSFQDSLIRNARALHVLTAKEKTDVRGFLSSQQIHEIPNYPSSGMRDDVKPRWWDADYSNKTIFLFLGRIHVKKGCRELLEAWLSLCEGDPGFKQRALLVFCGWVDDMPEFTQFIESASRLTDNVLFAGPQFFSEKSRSFSAASFFILPSRSEGLPMAVIEAWSAGLPTIITKECNLDIGFREGAAILTTSNPDCIAASIRSALSMDVAEYRVMSARARDVVASRFTSQRVSDALFAMYKSASTPS